MNLVKPSPFRHRKLLDHAYQQMAQDAAPAKRKYGCLMAVVGGDVGQSVYDWARDNIPESELGKDGYGDDPHITVLYGLKDDSEQTLRELKAVLSRTKPFKVRLCELTSFEDRGDGAPLIVEVESKELHRLNAYIQKNFDCHVKFPKYKPHLTVAYVLPECVDRYIRDAPFTYRDVEITHMIYSTAGRVKTVIPLGGCGEKALSPEEQEENTRRHDTRQDLDMLNSRGGRGRSDEQDYYEGYLAEQETEEKAARITRNHQSPYPPHRDVYHVEEVNDRGEATGRRGYVAGRREAESSAVERGFTRLGFDGRPVFESDSDAKALSAFDNNLGGALVPPPAFGLSVKPSPFRRRKALTPAEVEINRVRRQDKHRLDLLNNSYRNETTDDPVWNRHRARTLEGTTGGNSQNEPDIDDKSLPSHYTKAAPHLLEDPDDPNTRQIDRVLKEHDVLEPVKLDTALTAHERDTTAAIPPPMPPQPEKVDPKPAPEPPGQRGPQSQDVGSSPFRKQEETEGKQRSSPDHGKLPPSSLQQRRAERNPPPPPSTEAPPPPKEAVQALPAPPLEQSQETLAVPLVPPPPGVPQPLTEGVQHLQQQLATDAPLTREEVQNIASPEFLALVPPQIASGVSQRLLLEIPGLSARHPLPTVDDLVRFAQPKPVVPQQQQAQPQEPSVEHLARTSPTPDPDALSRVIDSPVFTDKDAETALAQIRELPPEQIATYVQDLFGFVPPPVPGKDAKQTYVDMIKQDIDSRKETREENPRPVVTPNPNYKPEQPSEQEYLRSAYTSPASVPQPQVTQPPEREEMTIFEVVPQADHNPLLLASQMEAGAHNKSPEAIGEILNQASSMTEDHILTLVQDLTGGIFRPQNGMDTRQALLAELRDWAVRQGVPAEKIQEAVDTKRMKDEAGNLAGEYHSDESLLRAFGVPQDGTVGWRNPVGAIKDYQGRTVGYGVEVGFSHPAFKQLVRAFGVDADGKRFMRNLSTEISDDYKGQGVSTKVILSQIKQAIASGINYIANDSVTNSETGKVGGNVWFKLGYNATLEDIHKQSPAYARKIADNFPDAVDLLDVASAPGGREWLSKYGQTVGNMRLDLTPGSKSMQVADAVRARLEAEGKL